MDFPAFHSRPSAPTNLTLHQAIEINGPIGCGDAPVFPGDVIVGDADGVIVLPAELADELADEATEMTAYDDSVTKPCAAGGRFLASIPPPIRRCWKGLPPGAAPTAAKRHRPEVKKFLRRFFPKSGYFLPSKREPCSGPAEKS